jgi:hypothetical protein
MPSAPAGTDGWRPHSCADLWWRAQKRRILDRVIEEFKLHIPRRESSVCGCGRVIYKAVAVVDTQH